MAWFDFVLGYLGNLITIIIDVTFDGAAKKCRTTNNGYLGCASTGSMMESVSFDVPEHRATLIVQRPPFDGGEVKK